jgi:DNA-binding MarR family transcriptional regulator
MKVKSQVDDPRVNGDALRLVGTMLRFVRGVSRSFSQSIDADLSVTDVGVLNLVHRGTDLPSLVARELKLDPPRVTRITDHLVQLGLMEREDDPEDRRRSRLRLTAAGLAQLDLALTTVSRSVDDVLDKLPEEQRKALIESVVALRSVVDSRE